MSSPRGIAYELLNANQSDSDSAVKFMDCLIDLEQDLNELEEQIVSVELSATGYRTQNSLQPMEKQYVELLQEINIAEKTLVTNTPWEFERCDVNWKSEDQNDFIDFRQDYIGQINHLETMAGRIGQILNAKQSTANSRMIAVISVIAVLVSTLTLILSAIGIV